MVKKKLGRRQVIDSNNLSWSKVDDFGIDGDDGIFYGLEEIDNVGIDAAGGTLNFLVVDTDPERSVKPKIVKPRERVNAKHDDGMAEESPAVKKSPKKRPRDEQTADGSVKKSNEMSTKARQIKAKPIETLGNWPKLNPRILGALKALEFTAPTPIQEQCLDPIIDGFDVIGKAATGSGKTLAYGLPLIEAFLESPGLKSVIIAPTRELAHQIRDHMNAVIKLAVDEKTAGVVALTGGLAIAKQLRLLENNPVAMVGTPGRMLEVLEQFTAAKLEEYAQVPSIVLDEADRLVQSNSFEELDKILDVLGRGRRQTMVFSATFEPELWTALNKQKKKRDLDIKQLLHEKLGLKRNAKFVDVDPKEALQEKISQSVMDCPALEKDLYLYYFLYTFKGKTIVFLNSIDAVKRVVPLLKELGLEAFGVHSDMIQKQRLRSLERFKACKAGVLLATDVAARGLDVPQVDHVVHYHLPRTADMYVHRSGRTARAGAQGVSVVLCDPSEAAGFQKLRKLVKSQVKTFDVDYQVLDPLRARVRLAKQIADSNLNKTKTGKTSSWIERAAKDLDLELSDDEIEKLNDTRRKAPKQDLDVQALRSELADLLGRRLMPSRKYLSSGSMNLAHELATNPDALLPGKRTATALEQLSIKRTKR